MDRAQPASSASVAAAGTVTAYRGPACPARPSSHPATVTDSGNRGGPAGIASLEALSGQPVRLPSPGSDPSDTVRPTPYPAKLPRSDSSHRAADGPPPSTTTRSGRAPSSRCTARSQATRSPSSSPAAPRANSGTISGGCAANAAATSTTAGE